MKIYNYIIPAVLMGTLCACDDMFKPAIENNHSEQAMLVEQDYAQGLLGYGYGIITPNDFKSNTDVATDDAVTNDKGSSYMQMALGTWSSSVNPVSQWDSRKCGIQYINLFLNIVEKVKWSGAPVKQQMFIDKLTGEALALRAFHYYYLLQAHSGYTEDGRLLGVPLLLTPEDGGSDFNQPRAPFADCVQQLIADLDRAIELLPTDYADLKQGEENLIPAKYREMGCELGSYNLVFGAKAKGRMSGRVAEAIRAQIAHLAASPAFRDDSGITPAQAADYAAVVLKRIGGVAGLDPMGHRWYMNTEYIDDLKRGEIPEIIWRGDRTIGTDGWDLGIDQEKTNFPPTLYGSGRINPSQNLVDAFPAANGYPITDAASGYDPANPYTSRDPRLAAYIIYNEAKFKDTKIVTGTYEDTDNGLNKTANSTRTGYYLKKLMREDCSPNPSSTTAQYHFPVRIRYTEIFLAYAEMANDAWGASGAGSNGFSAYDVIKAIRQRGGITGGDPYLEACRGDQTAMTNLIRNERRIELCFENKRFWDLRRWKMPLNEAVKGMQVDKNSDGTLKYTVINVEDRKYDDSYMWYGPIPNGEVLKWSNLDQNKGWR